ncbi:hypothetical protein IAT40_006512 [Kwoniella sp. CBS 6097]
MLQPPSCIGVPLFIALSALVGSCTAHPQPLSQQQSAGSQAQTPNQPQAASPSSSDTSASAASPTSAANGDRQYVNIPTSTIVSIGVGFVAFSSVVLMALLLMRVLRLRKIAAARGMSFRVVWRNEGGFWGFWTSFSGSDAELLGVGGGGHWGMRVIRDRLKEAEMEKMRPLMWESEWYNDVHKNEGEMAGEPSTGIASMEEMDCPEFMPLSVRPSVRPPTPLPPPHTALASDPKPIHAASLPQLDLCVLIQFPSATPYDPKSEELPELIIGRTTLLPIISSITSPLPTTNPNPPQDATHEPKSHMRQGNGGTRQEEAEAEIASRLAEGKDKGRKGEIQQIEYADTSHLTNIVGGEAVRRRAEWRMVKGHWAIEGL